MAARTREELLHRILALTAVSYRVNLEASALRTAGSREQLESMLHSLEHWLDACGARAHLTEIEQRCFAAPLGSVAHGDLVVLGWRVEALVALLWSVGLVLPMPSYDHPVTAATRGALPLGQTVEDLGQAAAIVDEERLEQERSRAELWTWRARTEGLRRAGLAPPPGETYEGTITRAGLTALSAGVVSQLLEGDLPCLGKPYRQLSDAELSAATATAQQRCQALNWLCGGFGDAWDEVRIPS